MKINRQSITDIEIEKEIITGIITNTQFLKELQQIYSLDMFQTPYGKTIVKWCFDFYQSYNKAPDANIQEIYNSYSNNGDLDEAQVELIGKFLSSLSNKYTEKTNVDYQIDKAEKYFRKRKIEILRENLGLLLLEDQIDEGEKIIADYKRPARSGSIGVDVIHGDINKYLNAEDDVLFQFPGELGELISPFCREDFVSIAGPMKRGKSLWLLEIGLKAMNRGFNVIFYSFESSEKKMLQKIYQNLMGETKKEKEISIPYFDDGYIEYQTSVKKGISQKSINIAKKKYKKIFGAGFWLSCFPTYSKNVEDIKIHLDNLEHYNNYIPDIIIIDYADILAPERNSSKEERHKLNTTWLALRGLAQERKALVVTGTQLSRATFNRDATEEDIVEDIRKLAHVTHMIALNQSKEDKKNSIMRVQMLAVRDDEYHSGEEVIVLESKHIANPFLAAKWKKNVKNYQK